MDSEDQEPTFRYVFHTSRVKLVLLVAFCLAGAVFSAGLILGVIDHTFEGRRSYGNSLPVQIAIFCAMVFLVFYSLKDQWRHTYGVAMTPEGVVIPRLGSERPVPWADVTTVNGHFLVRVDRRTYPGVKQRWFDRLETRGDGPRNIDVFEYFGGHVAGGKRRLTDLAAQLKNKADAGWPSRSG
jgi:hypothetical protein